MITIKVINIKNPPYFFNSMTNIKKFDPNLSNINKISFEKNTVLFMKLNISKF